jgi:hypothetical protein
MGPTGPTGPAGPTGPTGPGADLLVYSNVADAGIPVNATNFLGRCKNTGDVGEEIVMLRQGRVVSIYATSYTQQPDANQNFVYSLLLNNTIVATLTIGPGNSVASQTGLNIPFNFGDRFTVNVRNSSTNQSGPILATTSFFVGVEYI